MREFFRLVFARQLVAVALAGVLAFGLHVFLADDRASARDDIVGPTRVVDGDTVDVGGIRIRLEGIDAPEMAQECGTAGHERWRCGLAASKALAGLIDGASIACRPQGRDKYGRILAVCYRDGVDLNQEMVRTGQAWAFVRYSGRYVAVEAEARSARRGIWRVPSQPAWEYRAGSWQVAEVVAPQGCAIKGNVSRHGHIYHMPWSRYYVRVKIDEARGERWFCTESEAMEAGFRPSAAQ